MNFRRKITDLQKRAAVPRRANVQGSQTFVSLNSMLESNKEEEEAWPEVVHWGA